MYIYSLTFLMISQQSSGIPSYSQALLSLPMYPEISNISIINIVKDVNRDKCCGDCAPNTFRTCSVVNPKHSWYAFLTIPDCSQVFQSITIYISIPEPYLNIPGHSSVTVHLSVPECCKEWSWEFLNSLKNSKRDKIYQNQVPPSFPTRSAGNP